MTYLTVRTKLLLVLAVIAILFCGIIIRSRLAASAAEGSVKPELSQDDLLNGGPKVGEIAPNFTLPDLAGRMRSLQSFRGRPVILGFFCGCDRCHAAALKIAAQQKRGRLRNVVAVVAMDARDADKFRQTTGLTGQILLDESDKTMERYSSEFCPRLWCVADDGKITYSSSEALSGQNLDRSLAKIVQ